MLVKKLTYAQLLKYTSTRCRLTSDCEFFPNFNVTGIVDSINIQSNEYVINIKTEPTGKIIPVGSNMRNLKITTL